MPILVPFAHTHAPVCNRPPRQSEVSYEFVSDSFAVIASRSYADGEQVFVNYGQTNDGLMQYYGFSEVRIRVGGG